MKSFNGLSLNPTDVIENSLNMISAGEMFRASNSYGELGDELTDIAHQYLKEAAQTVHGKNKQCSNACSPRVGKSIVEDRMKSTASGSTTSSATPSSTPLGPFYYPATSTIGDRIREMRKLRDLSPNQLAHLLGVKPKAISMWELDFSSPTCNRLIKIANILSCDPIWLLTGEHFTRQVSTDIGELQHHHAFRPTDGSSREAPQQ